MKPSKKRSRRKRKPFGDPPPESTAGGSFQSREEEGEDEESRALRWLIEAFGSASLDQIASAYHEAGRDAYRASGILGAHLVNPEEEDEIDEKKNGSTPRKQKRVAAATGMVSNVIGKGYSKAGVSFGRRNSDVCQEAMNRRYSPEEGEQFLCSMLGDNSELGMGVVRDVLGQCGYNVEKALDALLEISASSYIHFREKDSDGYTKASIDYSGICPEISNNSTSFQLTDKKLVLIHRPSKRVQEVLEYEGYCNRENTTDTVDSVEQPPSHPGIVKADFQQQVLKTLFNIHDLPKYEPKFMNWKKVVQKVESFGQGLDFRLTSLAESPQDAGNCKGDVCEEFRSVSRKHWDEMRNYYEKAAVAYSRGDRAHAAILSEKGKYYSKLAREADEKVITGCGADGVGKGRLKRSVIDLVEREGIAWSKENAGTIILQLDGHQKYSFIECDSDSE